VFGKSTVARRLAEITGLPLVGLDILVFPDSYRSERDGGGKISDEQYSKLHSEILDRPEWVIDRYGSRLRRGNASPSLTRSSMSICRRESRSFGFCGR
jgi:hypothetical protein